MSVLDLVWVAIGAMAVVILCFMLFMDLWERYRS